LRRLFSYGGGSAIAAGVGASIAHVMCAHAKTEPDRSLAGRTAIVTGSTSGIGLAIAESLAEAGCSIVLNGFGDAQEISRLTHQLAQRHDVAVIHDGADVTNAEEVRSMVARVEHHFGAVDILVNNAGIQHVCPLKDFPDAKWDQVLAVNLTSAFHTTKACMSAMSERGYGRVINIASAHGQVASVHKSAYVASKHGVVGLTKVTALETAGSGVTANAVCPGWVLTPLVQKQIEVRAAASGRSVAAETQALVSEKHPSGQAVQPVALGQLVVFLCSRAADQITGAVLSVDGGWTAQ